MNFVCCVLRLVFGCICFGWCSFWVVVFFVVGS